MSITSVRVWVEGVGWDVYDYATKEWHQPIIHAMRMGLKWDFAFIK